RYAYSFSCYLFRAIAWCTSRDFGMLRHLGSRNDRGSKLAEEIGERCRGVGNQESIAVIVCGNVFERIEILCHQNELHHVLRRRTGNSFREILDESFSPEIIALR